MDVSREDRAERKVDEMRRLLARMCVLLETHGPALQVVANAIEQRDARPPTPALGAAIAGLVTTVTERVRSGDMDELLESFLER